MKKKILISLILISMFAAQIIGTASNKGSQTESRINGSLIIAEDGINIPSYLIDDIDSRKEIRVYQENETFAGYTLFNCNWGGRDGNLTTIIMDMDGNIIAAEGEFSNDPELINSTTVFLNNLTHAVFWNLETNVLEYIEMPQYALYNQHHDVEYNPATDQFLILGREFIGEVDIGGTPYTVEHDALILTDRDNNTLWYWSGAENIPFDQDYFYLTNHTGRGNVADWTHGNTVFWDMEEENVCYFNARHLHTIYKIDMTTGDIIWTLGEYESDFDLFNINDDPVTSFFYGAHSIERIGPNKYIIYDNDQFNTTDFASNWPRCVEFEIDEETWTAQETFTWTIPDNSTYFGGKWGDADHLPGDTRLGTFGAGGALDLDLLTEVNEAGEIIWELAVNGTDTYRAERFYSSPLVRIDGATLITDTKTDAIINLTVWNSFKERMSSDGQVSVYEGETLLYSNSFVFLPYWQDTDLSLVVPTDDYKKGTYNLSMIIENSDGISTTIFFEFDIERAPVAGWVVGVSVTASVVVLGGAGGGTYYYLKKKKK